MFFWRRVAPQIPEDGLKPTATPSYTRNFREINHQVSQGKSFSGYERNSLFLNLEGNGFANVADILGVDFEDDSRAVAVVDWDRDGDLDLWLTSRTAPRVRLLKNNHSSGNSYLGVRLIGNGTTTNRDAVGARLTLSQPSTPSLSQIRTVHAGDGFLAQSTRWKHFGLGKTVDNLKLTVAWPGGDSETYSLKPNAYYTITQGKGPLAASTTTTPRQDSVVAVEDSTDDEAADGFWVANRVPFPKLNYSDDAGRDLATTDFLGKPVLVNLWATWCAPCVEELRVLGEHTNELKELGATVLALNVDGLAINGATASEANRNDLLARIGYDLPRGLARQETLAMLEVVIEYLCSRRTPLNLPTSFLVDAEGNVAAVYLGAIHWHQLAKDLALLQLPAKSQLARMSPRAGRWFANPSQIDSKANLSDYATRFATNGFTEESQRLFHVLKSRGGVNSAQDFYNQAKTAAQQGRTEQAIKYYREALRLDSNYGQALTGLGAVMLAQRRLDEAQRLFEKALSIDPNHATALINLAMIERSRGDVESALQRLHEVVARNPDYAAAHLNLGSLLASMKKHKEAIQHLSIAARLDPKSVPAQLNLATAFMEIKEWDKAAEHYRHVQQMNPRLAYPHFGLGKLFAAQGMHAEAVDSFRAAISLGGQNTKTYTYLGVSLMALGDSKIAIESFERALQLDPQNVIARNALRTAEQE